MTDETTRWLAAADRSADWSRVRATVAGLGRSGFAAADALLLLAVPTFLIGICKGAMMHCRMVMLPTLIVLGVLTIVFAAIAIWLDSRAAKRN